MAAEDEPAVLELLSCLLLNPQIRIVWSSLAEANMWGFTGFQLTLFTVPEWPGNTSSRSPFPLCHM
jgi:hypothetical protein